MNLSTYCFCTKNLRNYAFVSLFSGIFVIKYKRFNCRIIPISGIRPDIKNGRISGPTLVLTIVFPCIGMIYNYRIWRNVFGISSTPWYPMDNSPLDVRSAFLLELTHYYLTVRRSGSSNHQIFMMLWVDSNQLPQELQASALTTHPLIQSFSRWTGQLVFFSNIIDR